MLKTYLTRVLWPVLAVCGAIAIYLGLQPLPQIMSAPQTGTTWYVTSASDNVSDGNVISHTGSLRFALAHATSGDNVRFTLNAENMIKVGSTLTVPEGVAVGYTRNEGCGNPTTPRANIEANPSYVVDPVFSLSANSTLRNVDVGGVNIVKITGENVDVCGAGLGILSTGDTNVLPATRSALIIDGDHAVIHRNIFYGENPTRGDIVVGINGSDSRIGDTLYGSGNSNEGWCNTVGPGLCTVKIITGSVSSAQRVTIRDAFPRTLTGMQGSGVSGGDDDPKHANNWAQTPTILIAETFDNFATIHVSGTANPLSLVDIYFFDNTGTGYVRQAPVTATVAGTFDFWGAGPGPLVQLKVVAASTLNDPAHPNRVGSSSQFTGRVQVTQGTNTTVLQLTPAALTFSALIGGANPDDQYLQVTAPTISPTLAWQTSVTTTGGLNWLSAAPLMGSGEGLITVTVDATGLTSGTYHGAVTVFDPANPTDRATANVTLDVTEPPPPPVPTLYLAPDALTFMAMVGGPAPDSQQIFVTIDPVSPTLMWSDEVMTANGLPWLSAMPSSDSGDNVLTITVNATGLMTGTYYGAVHVFEPGKPTDQVTATVTLNVSEPPFYGITLAPQQAAKSGDPGATVTYTLRVTNTGSTTDTFTLTSLGNLWTTLAPSTIGPLASGQGANLTVDVDVPSDAPGGATDTVDLTVTSDSDAGMWATAELTTTANVFYGVALDPLTADQSGNAGTTVTYTLRVTNTGNSTDTFTVNVTGNAWATNAPATVGPLASGASDDLIVTVDIPSDASNTSMDMALIDMASQGDPSQQTDAILITTAIAAHGVRLEPPLAAQSGDAGTTVTYTLRLTNTGQTTDTLTSSYSGNTWNVSLSPVQVELPAGEGGDVQASVSIPVTATGGMIDAVQVTVTGTGVSDASALVTAAHFKFYLPLVMKNHP